MLKFNRKMETAWYHGDKSVGAGKMAQPDYLSSIPRTHMIE